MFKLVVVYWRFMMEQFHGAGASPLCSSGKLHCLLCLCTGCSCWCVNKVRLWFGSYGNRSLPVLGEVPRVFDFKAVQLPCVDWYSMYFCALKYQTVQNICIKSLIKWRLWKFSHTLMQRLQFGNTHRRKHLKAQILSHRHIHQNNDGNWFYLGALKGEWGNRPVRHSFFTNNRSSMSCLINKCMRSTLACFSLIAAET